MSELEMLQKASAKMNQSKSQMVDIDQCSIWLILRVAKLH